MARKAFIMACNGPESMGRLKYAELDAKIFAAKLQSFRYGFEIVTPQKGSDPFDVMKLLRDTALSCERDDDFICYFSGHGDLAKGQLQLVLSDEPKPIELISLDVDIVQNYIKKCRSKNKLFILDCCHSGGAVGIKGGGADKLLEEITPFTDNDNHLVLVASERLAKIREYADLKGSFLTRKICEALDEQFNLVDQDKDQRISISDLMEYLQTTRKHYNWNKPEDKKVPLPYIFGQQKGVNFYFTQDKYRWSPVEHSCKDGSTLVILPIPEHSGNCLFMSKYPLTNAQYKMFVAEAAWKKPQGRFLISKNEQGEMKWKQNFEPWADEKFNEDNQPVVCVSYKDAVRYCEWLESKRDTWSTSLPKGAVTSGFVPPVNLWNVAAYGSLFVRENYGNTQEWLSQTKEVHHKANEPAKVYDKDLRTNARGITDMFGNVWQWCAPEITFNFSLNRRFRGHPVLKGGGFQDNLSSGNFVPELNAYQITVGSKTEPADFKSFDLGLRVAGTIRFSDLSLETRLKLSLCPPIDERFWYEIDNYKFSG